MDDERFRVPTIPSGPYRLPKLTFFGNSTKRDAHQRLAAHLHLKQPILFAKDALEKPHMLLLPDHDPLFTPTIPSSLSTGPHTFESIRQGDILLFHPYESFYPIVSLLEQAAVDPQVLDPVTSGS